MYTTMKTPIPVCGSTHFLLLICARGRVSVSIVVKTVEGVVRVIEHIYTLRSGIQRDPKCPLTLLAKAQQQQPVLLLCSATMLCSASWHSLTLSSAGDGCLQPPLLVPAALQEWLQVSRMRTTSLWSLDSCSGLSHTNLQIYIFCIYFVTSTAHFLWYPRWPAVQGTQYCTWKNL